MSEATAAQIDDEEMVDLVESEEVDEVEAGEPEAPPTDDPAAHADASDEVAQDDAAAPEPESAPPATREPEPEARPFAFKADDREWQIEGAEVRGDEVRMPLDTFLRKIQPHFVADRGTLVQRGREQGRKEAESGLGNHPDVVRARETLKRLDEKFREPPEQIATWLADVRRNWPLLQAQAQNAALAAQIEARQKQEKSQTDTQQTREFEEAARASLKGYVAEIAKEFKGVDVTLLSEEVEEDWERFIVEADEDGPNWRRGDKTVNLGKLRSKIERAHKLIEKVRPKDPPKPSAAKVSAAKKNEAASRDTSAPPVVSAKGSSIPGDKPKFDVSTKEGREAHQKYMKETYGVEF